MRILLLIILASISIKVSAQDANIFLDRSFWKTAPNIELVKQRISEGNDPVALNPFAFDAVTFSILENTPLETIKYLLSIEGNEVNKVTHDGRNYLMWAAYKGNIDLMQFLIDQGSKTDIVDNHGYNLMTFAAVAGQSAVEIYELILGNGGTPNDTNREGANALLLLAPHLKDESMIQYFQQKGVSIHYKDHEGNGMFYYAARLGNIEMMDKLIEMGLDYKNLNKVGGNAVIAASRGFRRHTNSLDVYTYLESKGIAANVITKEGTTPLHGIAHRTKDFGIFDYFINKGVALNQVDKEGNTVFLNAVRGRNFEVAKKLAPMVKDINHEDKGGHSALTHSVRRNSVELVDFLLLNGASVNLIDKEGNSLAYHVFDAYKVKEEEAFKKNKNSLKSKGVDFRQKQSDGNTLLHLAAEKGAPFLVETAIELGNDINAKNGNGLTPLHLAAMKAVDDKLLLLLIEHGADKSAVTDFDETVFDLASENELLKDKEVDIKFLK